MAFAQLTIVRSAGPAEWKQVSTGFSGSNRCGALSRVELGSVGERRSNGLRVQAAQYGSAPHPFQPSPPLEPSAEAPLIELEFIPPDNRAGETDPIPDPEFCTAVSGQKLLRDVMLENQIELYGPYGKMMNCEGRGMCGTCLVDILEGAEQMNKRTPAEPYYLKLRPDSWRLACQATVGDGINGGKIKVKRRPQKGHPLM